MGAGIAQVSVDKSMRTILKDMNVDGISRGINQVCGFNPFQNGNEKLQQKTFLGIFFPCFSSKSQFRQIDAR